MKPWVSEMRPTRRMPVALGRAKFKGRGRRTGAVDRGAMELSAVEWRGWGAREGTLES